MQEKELTRDKIDMLFVAQQQNADNSNTDKKLEYDNGITLDFSEENKIIEIISERLENHYAIILNLLKLKKTNQDRFWDKVHSTLPTANIQIKKISENVYIMAYPPFSVNSKQKREK